MFTPSGWGYSRLEMWMEANYDLDVGGKPESLGVLLRLDSIYQQELSKGVSEKKLRGVACIHTNTEEHGVNHQINGICA